MGATVALALPSTAAAKPVASDLRVEAGGKALAGGARFVNDTARIQTDRRSACEGTGQVKTLVGPTALGLVSYAARISHRLRPFSVSDHFSFGLFVCGIGGFLGPVGDANRYWIYRVDHVVPDVGGDQLSLRGGAQVLWYLVDNAAGVNTGDELRLIAPARARSGGPFEVTVYAYDFAGRRRPAAGAQVVGESAQTTDSQGHATIVSSKRGRLRLRAVRGPDIPSEPLSVCLDDVVSRCPAVRGRRIFGTNRGDRIRGTRGADVVYGRGGNDRIDVRRGSRDRVRCGSGRDRVRLGSGDRATRDCERVLR